MPCHDPERVLLSSDLVHHRALLRSVCVMALPDLRFDRQPGLSATSSAALETVLPSDHPIAISRLGVDLVPNPKRDRLRDEVYAIGLVQTGRRVQRIAG